MPTKRAADFYQRFMAEANGRRAHAFRLRKAGKTYEQIGAELGISKQRAYDLVRRAKLDSEAASGA